MGGYVTRRGTVRREAALDVAALDVAVRGDATTVVGIRSAVTYVVPFCVANAGVLIASRHDRQAQVSRHSGDDGIDELAVGGVTPTSRTTTRTARRLTNEGYPPRVPSGTRWLADEIAIGWHRATTKIVMSRTAGDRPAGTRGEVIDGQTPGP